MEPIPRIIHQTWKTSAVPERFAPFVDGWRRHHPGWRHVLWTDRSMRAHVRQRHPGRLSLYDGYDAHIKRVDMFRYLLMHDIGGVYADLDVECLGSLEPILDGLSCLIGQEPEIHARRLYGRARLVSNAVLASAPGHRFWAHVLDRLPAAAGERDVLRATGPMLLDEALATYPHGDIQILPSERWCPLVDLANDALGLSPAERDRYRRMRDRRQYPAGTVAVHHWAGTWYTGGAAAALGRLWVRLAARLRP